MLPGFEGVVSSKKPYQPISKIDIPIKNRWNDFIPIIYTHAWSMYDISGRNIIIKKNQKVNFSFKKMCNDDVLCINNPIDYLSPRKKNNGGK